MEHNNCLEVESLLHQKNCSTVREAAFQAFSSNLYPVAIQFSYVFLGCAYPRALDDRFYNRHCSFSLVLT